MRDRGFSRDRYFQEDIQSIKLIAEGVEGQVPYKGALATLVFQLVGGLRSAMGYLGAATIRDLQINSRFMRVTTAAMDESHPHDVMMTKQAPNYWGR
jgi:IMP dehydrogenase